jgi:outer membrane protein assembly factor BamB/tRNA A-37 threonylcarbamoyl transferase component Bud32
LPAKSLLMRRYLIQDVIGSGGMGAVYRARDMHFPNAVKLVAIKEMVSANTDPKINQMMIKNFEREANLLVTLSHPSINRINDYFSIDQRAYLVLDYVYGKDLERILDRVTDFIPENQVIKWAVQMCDVLEYLHSHEPEPIIFRDIKPSNIMINRQGNVILIDFGIAKTFQFGQKGTIIGTEGYAPPEQYRGEATPSVDIYALGATLHHLFTRHDPTIEPPFTFEQRPIHNFNTSVSNQMVEVIEKALQYNASDRFASAKEMKLALIKAGNETGLLSSIDPVLSLSVSTQAEAVAKVPDQLVKPIWTFKCEDEIRGSAAIHDRHVFIGSYDHNIYKLNLADGKFIWKFPAKGGIVSTPAFDGNLVYFGSEDRNIYAVDTTTGKKAWEYETHAPVRGSAIIKHEHVFIGSDDCNLYAISAVSGLPAWKAEAMTAIRARPVVTEDRVIFVGMDGEMLCVDMGGMSKWRFNAKRGVIGHPYLDQSEGILFFTSMDSTLYALDARTGWAIWRYRMEKGSVSSPIVLNDRVFMGSADGNIYCINKNNGRLNWSYQTDAQVSGSPITDNDRVFIGDAEGAIYCLDVEDGNLFWKFQTQGHITGRPALENGVLVFGSADQHVYAIAV